MKPYSHWNLNGRRSIAWLAFIPFLFFVLYCSSNAPLKDFRPKKIQIMTFNVENLFDTVDAPKKRDETFLPMDTKRKLSLDKICGSIKTRSWRMQCQLWDWNQETLSKKMQNLAQVILSVNEGRGPDILILQEVENKEVLEVFNQHHLRPAGYQKAILIEGRDLRGIDVAILSRYTLLEKPKLEYVSFSKGTNRARIRDTRGILKAKLKVDDKESITVLANHFPAPFHPLQMRVDSFKKLNQMITDEDGLVVAAGDFNVSSEEDGKYKLLNANVAPQWTIAHRQGCTDCKGTNYYSKNDSWSFLDMILIKRNDMNGWKLLSDETKVIQLPIHTEDGHPKRFDPKNKEGVSDHWPLFIVLQKSV